MRATVGYLIKVLFPLVLTAAAVGEDGTWQGPSGGNWSDAANWVGGVPDGVGDAAMFSVDTGGSFIAEVDQAVTLGRLQVDGQGILELTEAGPFLFATDDGSGAGTIALEATPERSLAVQVRSDVGLGEGTDRLVAELGERTILALYGSLLTPDLDLVQNGTGTLELRGASPDWQGGLTIAGGTARVFDARALGGVIGATTIQSGAVLQLESGVNIGQEPLRLDGGTVIAVGDSAISNSPIELTANSRIERPRRGDSMTLTGVIQGVGGIEFVRGHTTIVGMNTYEGTTVLTDASVTVRNTFALGTIAGSTILGDSSLLMMDAPSSEPIEIRGGELRFGDLDSTVYSGTVTLSHGVLRLERQRNFSAPVILDQVPDAGFGGAHVLGDFSSFSGGTTGMGDVVFDRVTTFADRPLAHEGGVSFQGGEGSSDQIQLTVPNSYTGTTRIREAILVIDDVRTLGSPGSTVLIERGGVLELNHVPDKDFEVRGGQLIVVPSDEPIERPLVLDRGELGGRGTFNGPIILADSPIGPRTDTLIRGGVFNGPLGGQATLTFFNDVRATPPELTPATELNGDNSYRGYTQVMAGFVNANTPSALGSPVEATIVGGADAVLNVNASTTEPLVVVPGGIININAPLDRLPMITGVPSHLNRANGVANVNVPSSDPRKTEILHGTLRINADTTLGDVLIRTDGELIVADGAVASIGSGVAEIQDGRLQGRLQGVDRIIKTTMGRAKLGPLPGYDGQIAVEQGILDIHNPAALGSQIGATHLLGEASAELHIFGSHEIAEDIYLNNAQGIGGRGALQVFRGEDGNEAVAKLTGRVDLGDVGSVFSGSTLASVLELAGSVSGGSLIKKGEALRLVVTGEQNAYTGLTDVQKGVLEVSGAGSLQTTSGIRIHSGGRLALSNYDQELSDRIGDAVPVDFHGGELTVSVPRSDPITEVLGAVNLLEGHSQIQGLIDDHDRDPTSAVRLTSLERAPGSTGWFHSGVKFEIDVENGPELDDGILPWLLMEKSYSSSSRVTGFATYGDNGLEPFVDYTEGLNSAAAADNVLLTADNSPILLGQDATINSLNANGKQLDLQGHTLTLASGGLIGVDRISGGRITAGEAPNAELLTTGGQFFADIVDNQHGSVDFVVYSGGAAVYGTNTYSGATIVNDGDLDLRSENALPEGTVVSMVGGELQFNYGSENTKHLTSLRLAGNSRIRSGNGRILAIDHLVLESGEIWDIALAGDGLVEKLSDGVVDLRLVDSPMFSGNLVVRDGTLTLAQLGTAVIRVEGGTLNYTGGNDVILAGGTAALSGTGSVHVAEASQIAVSNTNFHPPREFGMHGAISGSNPLRFVGTIPDTLAVVAGSSPDFSGQVEIQSTTVDIHHENSLGTAEIEIGAGGRLRLSPLQMTQESSRLDLPNRVVLDGGSVLGFDSVFQPQRLVGELDVRADSRIGALEVLGPVVLRDGAVLTTIAGQPTLFAGPITVEGDASIRIGQIAEFNAPGGTIADTVRVTGGISSGSEQSRLNFVLTGLDRLSFKLTAQQDQSLEILVNDTPIDLLIDEEGSYVSGKGTIMNNIIVADGAAVAPGGSVGRLTLRQGLRLAGDSVYEWEISDAIGQAGGPHGWDLLRVDEELALTATADEPLVLRVVGLDTAGEPGEISNFAPDRSYEWQIAEAHAVSGFSPDRVRLDLAEFLFHHPLTDVSAFALQAQAKGLWLSYTPGGLPGDYNGNGLVEQADLDLVLGHWGSSAATPPDGWVNDLPSGVIDQQELDRVLTGWGRSLAGLSAPAAAVPEPASCLLAVIAFAAALRFSRAPRRGR
jgi:autotransporter-associated beta strand protein